MIKEEDILVRQFKGADAPVLLTVVSDFLMALWATPIYNIKGIRDPKEFLVKTIAENNVDKIVEDIVLFTTIDKEVVSLIMSFAMDKKTGIEYRELGESSGLDEVLLVIKVVLKKFLAQFMKTSFFLSLKESITSLNTTQELTKVEK